MIKQQFEQILKDTKILCELEPFVKKWSFEEMLPHFQISNSINENNKLSPTEILRDIKAKSFSNNRDDGKYNIRKALSRSAKEVMMALQSNDDDSSHSFTFDNLLLEDQYDRELEKTLKVLQEIEDVQDAVTQTDIEDFVRGLGGKPDGLDLKGTNIREWKNIFLEHWLDLNHLPVANSSEEEENLNTITIREARKLMKERASLPNIIKRKSPIKKDHLEKIPLLEKSADRNSVFSSSRVNLDSHFMTRKESKNMVSSFKQHVSQEEKRMKNGLHPTSPYLFAEYDERTVAPEKRKSLLTLPKEHRHETSLSHMEEKTANSALIVASLPQHYKKSPINDLKQHKKLNFYEEKERQTKKNFRNNIIPVEGKFKAEEEQRIKEKNACQIQKLKDKRATMSVRPSSAVPAYNSITFRRGGGGVSSEFKATKSKKLK